MKEAVEAVVREVPYVHAKTSELSEQVSAAVEAVFAQDRLKVVVNVLLMEKSEAGFRASSSMLWDDAKDEVVNVRVENASLRAIVTVYIIAPFN